jgi:hypothetical protein
MEIRDVLNRRSDLSTFVVHFTRDWGLRSARDNLESILATATIRAESAMGWLSKVPVDQLENAKVVCFSETPLEHAYSLVQKINRRQVKLAPYGIVFSKEVARKKGVNPIWYVDMTPGQEAQWAIAEVLDFLRDGAVKSKRSFADHPATKIMPFIEQMGTWPTSEKEFWWEREWRHRGNFEFCWSDVTLVFCPEDEIEDIEPFGWPAVDPSWSLERMIERLARGNRAGRRRRQEQRRETLAES